MRFCALGAFAWTKATCFVFALCISVLVCGCVSTQRELYTDRRCEPPAADYQMRIIDLNNYDRPFETIGHVRIKASRAYPPEMVMKRLKKAARRMGGHALNDVTQQTLPRRFPALFDYLNFYDVAWSAEVVRWFE